MARDVVDALFPDEGPRYSFAQVVSITGFDEGDVTLLVECGALVPDDPRAAQWTFSAWSLEVARRARGLQREFALDDVHAVAVVLRFEQRLRALERELEGLRARGGR